MSIYPFIGMAIAAALRVAYRSWAATRNALPDEERALIFWNDDRYEALHRWVWRAVYGFCVVGGAFAIWIFGLSQQWWCWPYSCA